MKSCVLLEIGNVSSRLIRSRTSAFWGLSVHSAAPPCVLTDRKTLGYITIRRGSSSSLLVSPNIVYYTTGDGILCSGILLTNEFQHI